ncbi:TetR/AcrR family transcriptional regulator [Streptomyces sp. NPDC000410]|uniref:TetR/AcrR family transcriptional regulator n=1 Tax=Streptomyces sp. NPDC000410 TaxID=3154254 RepID=UPI00331735AE
MDHQGVLRERLVDVGVDLVKTEGPGALGLREIARRAGVSHGAPRRHFPTHHSLLSAIARRGFEELKGRFTEAAGTSASARGQLEAIGRAYVGYALEYRGMFELMWRHDLLDSAGLEPEGPGLRTATLPLFEAVIDLVGRCRTEQDDIRRSQLPGDAVTAAALWTNLHGIAQLWTWGSLQLALDALVAPPADVPPSDGAPDRTALDRLVSAALDAHLGPAGA